MSGKKILGVSAFYHDSAAALVVDGCVVAAAQEERFTRKKHDPRFPVHAIGYCLEEADISASELDAVVFYDKPIVSFDRVVKSLLHVAPRGLELFRKAVPPWMGVKLFVRQIVQDALKVEVPVLFAEHHHSHAASAFFPSPFEEAAILTMDGVGEWSTASIGVGQGSQVEMLKELRFPHSVGLLYSAATYFCGFKVNSGEYKLMGLAPYGRPRYVDVIKREVCEVHDDGSIHLNLDLFGFLDEERMTNERFAALFGGSRREPESRITRREMDIAASIQQVTEEIVLKMAAHARELTGKRHLVMAGGVALNCVANGHLLRAGIFDDIWIQPAAGDAGGALGAALLGSYQFSGEKRPRPQGRDGQKGSYLGPKYSTDEVKAYFDSRDLPFREVSDTERATQVASALAEGKIVGYMVGRMEFGPRALGARSILGDPRSVETQRAMNLKIKYRESFRPFAPSVLGERVSDFFELDRPSPYMLLVAPVAKERCVEVPVLDADDMLEQVNQRRSDIPAVTHVDYSARVQTVHADSKPDYHAVIKAFEELTGYGVIVNTSFNVRGEPIVCNAHDAYMCFMRTEMDVLVVESCILEKSEQPPLEGDDDWRSEYELD